MQELMSIDGERENLNVLGEAREQEILKFFQAELLRASRFQEIILEEVICTHTHNIQCISCNEFCPFFTHLSSQVDLVMCKIL